MRVLDVFSGIGGFSLACRMANELLGYEHFVTFAFAEIEPFCRAVLKKHWPDVYQFEDVKNVTAEFFRDRGIDFPGLIVGGFPCQPHSVAGQKKGAQDARNLWPEFSRIIGELRPAYVLAENVPNLANTMLDTVTDDLHRLGYEVGCYSLSAEDMGATHRRERLWIMAYSGHGAERPERCTCEGRNAQGERSSCDCEVAGSSAYVADSDGESATGYQLGTQQERPVSGNDNRDVADADSSRRGEYRGEERGSEELASSQCGSKDVAYANMQFPPARNDFRGWGAVAEVDASQMPCVEREIRRKTNGVSGRLVGTRNQRLKALGNSIVPQCAVPFLLTIARSE